MRCLGFIPGCVAVWFIAAATAGAQGQVSLMALAPQNLYAGGSSSITVTSVYTADRTPADVAVSVWLEKTGEPLTYPLASGITGPQGRFFATFSTPDVTPGAFQIKVQSIAAGVTLQSPINVRSVPVLFVETDKPIYRPGQTIKGRVLMLNHELLPASESSVITITDAKSIKLFQEEVTANSFGVAPFELPLASDLNFGTWKITAQKDVSKTTVDVRVEKYVLPKFNLDIQTDQDYFLVSDPVRGAVSAFYFFGQPIQGTVDILASRYIGLWDQYATYSGALANGRLEFELPPVNYVTGTPANGGAGSLLMEVTVTDTSGHKETVSEFFKVPQSGLQLQLIPGAARLMPGMPCEVTLAATSPGGAPVDVSGNLHVDYATLLSVSEWGGYYQWSSSEDLSYTTVNGLARITFTPPADVVKAALTASVSSGALNASASVTLYGEYSPTSNFIHLVRASTAPLQVGDSASFQVIATSPGAVYYDVFAAGRTVFSAYTTHSEITFTVTPAMAPSAKVVAYVINPNNEISADSFSFDVATPTAVNLQATFNAEQVLPGEPVQVGFQAGQEAMIGVSIVDQSVYALNQGRLNLREVFDELESLYMEPQQEYHPYGAYDIFNAAGYRVLTDSALSIPKSPSEWSDGGEWGWEGEWEWDMEGLGEGEAVPSNGEGETGGGLAEVSRIRQFFPETWVWMPELMTDASGAAQLDLTAPDSITTWKLHAVSTSDAGIGITESELTVFQEFFGEPDLPYAVTRGEMFPVRVQIYNYLDNPQSVQVELTCEDWFTLSGEDTVTVDVPANSVGAASFLIQPTTLGTHIVEVTLRSPERADAVRKPLLVEAEGTPREIVDNGTLNAGESLQLSRTIPTYAVADSGKVVLSVTPSVAAKIISGLDQLLNMPCGCGEQNMIYMAPDVQVLRYLDATGQASPEVRAKAETYVQTGYQRELTYRHSDGSFSAFGEDDPSGSLWLTGFVLKVFSDTRGLISIDDAILNEAAAWISEHQLANGSWGPVGFLHHQDMLGGASGVFPLTAFTALALHTFNPSWAGLTKAADFIAANLASAEENSYALAIAALALARMEHTAANTAINSLMARAISDAQGLHWDPYSIETTAYAALALFETGNYAFMNDAITWIAANTNSLGGYGNTQDTVMAIEALLTSATGQNRDINLTLTAYDVPEAPYEGEKTGTALAQFTIHADNFDILQQVELPLGGLIELRAEGNGRVSYQLVRRYNELLPEITPTESMDFDIAYSADHVQVDDIVDVTVKVRFDSPEVPMEGEFDGETYAKEPEQEASGMLLLDVGVPTGFTPVADSLNALMEAGLIKRFEVAGRKVILYIENMNTGQEITLKYQLIARFPVRALTPDSYAYCYYTPEVRDEVKGHEITIELEGSHPGVPGIHSADKDQSWSVSMSELLRGIQLYNSNGYHCQAGTEDGYAPDAGSTSCSPHASDYDPQDWRISLHELLRLIQFYNSSGYRRCEGTEDGYCPSAK